MTRFLFTQEPQLIVLLPSSRLGKRKIDSHSNFYFGWRIRASRNCRSGSCRVFEEAHQRR